MNVMEMFSLKGKVALVTGGAGQLGKQIVDALAEAGAKVYIASRNIEALEAVASARRDKGYDVIAMKLELGDEQSILNLKQRIFECEEKVDILVNNSVLKMMKDWNDSADAFTESMKINATGLFVITRAFGDEMARRGKGSIINIGSISGMKGPDGNLYYKGLGWTGFMPDYAFHKGGMINFTRFVASYYGLKNVRCNCISPGGLESEKTQEKYARRYRKKTMLGRMLNSTDLKGTVVYLASDASAFVTGVNIPVDGGLTSK